MTRSTTTIPLAAAALIAALVMSFSPTQAQQYPTKPITLIVPFMPGSSTSVIARAVTDKLSEALKQTIVIDNRGGADGTLGARAVAKSAPTATQSC